MRDDICTIPVSEVFEVNDGCPLCRMYNTVEERIIKYILGDAMMEPDVRTMTNEIGFCREHYNKMLSFGNRLQLSLMLVTHLDRINKTVFSDNPEKAAKAAKEINDSCFICNKINWGFERMIATVYRLYENEEDFRNLFNSQPAFCFKHYQMLMGGISKKTVKKHGKEMAENLNRITLSYSNSLYSDISAFCSMYDYHNAGKKDFGELKVAPEKTVDFLK